LPKADIAREVTLVHSVAAILDRQRPPRHTAPCDRHTTNGNRIDLQKGSHIRSRCLIWSLLRGHITTRNVHIELPIFHQDDKNRVHCREFACGSSRSSNLQSGTIDTPALLSSSRRFKPQVLLVFRGRSQKLLYFLAFPRRTLSYPADAKVVAMPALRIVQGGEAAFGRHYIDSNSCIWSGAANVPMLD